MAHAPFLPATITSPRRGAAREARGVASAGATRTEAKEASAIVSVSGERGGE